MSGFKLGVYRMGMTYYLFSCHFLNSLVKNNVNKALHDDPTLATGLVRLHFHDCFIEVLSLLYLHSFFIYTILKNGWLIFFFYEKDVMGQF